MITSPPEWLLGHADRSPDAPALGTPTDGWTSYSELAGRVRRLAEALRRQGLRPNDRVLVSLPLSLASAVAGLAVQLAGGCVADLTPELAPRTLAALAPRLRVRYAILAAGSHAAWLSALRAAGPLEALWIVGECAEAPGDALPLASDGSFDGGCAEWTGAAAASSPEAPALILATSGSSGTPHAVLLSGRNLFANSRAIAQFLRLGQADRALVTLPFSYCYGRSILQTHLLVGGSLFLEARSVFPQLWLEALRRERCTGLPGVPLTFELLRRTTRRSALLLPDLRYATQAGGALAPETLDWAREALRPAELYVMYGQTEATARLCYLPPERAQEKRGSVGIPVAGTEIRIVAPATEASAGLAAGLSELPRGQVGEVVARGEGVALGYLEAEVEGGPPEPSVFRDGWLWTGDLGRQDDEGFLTLVGRSKDLVKVAGHRVSPNDVEWVLERHPGVREAGVAGLPDPLGGEALAALVVPKPEANVSIPELQRFCRASLRSHLVPRTIVLVTELPRGPNGKLLREELGRRVRLHR
jgi:acyl-CoA synthetase (AMP-forming)/AMP-acid ligase II